MRRAFFLLVVFVLSSSVTATAQQWSPEQQEVWEFEKHCWQLGLEKNMEERKACFHEDYVGWYSTDPVPMPYSDTVVIRYVEKDRSVAYNMTPHSIMIHGNVAIIHLSGFTVEPGDDGKDKSVWDHWTDIALKEDGKWSWIADHGHPGPTN